MLDIYAWIWMLLNFKVGLQFSVAGTCYENRGGDAGGGDGEDPSCYGQTPSHQAHAGPHRLAHLWERFDQNYSSGIAVKGCLFPISQLLCPKSYSPVRIVQNCLVTYCWCYKLQPTGRPLSVLCPRRKVISKHLQGFHRRHGGMLPNHLQHLFLSESG